MKHLSQRGMALLIVLLLVATLAAVVSLAQSYGFDAMRRSSSIQTQQQSQWVLLSAETLLVSHYTPFLSAQVSVPDLPWKRQPFPFSIDDSQFHFQVRDLQTCFNLNALFATSGGKTQTHSEAQRVLRALLMQTGSDAKRAEEAIALLIRQGKQTGYLFADSRELNIRVDLPAAQRRLLQPLLCALPVTDLQININSLTQAHAPLLSALADIPIASADMQAFLAARPVTGWKTTEALTQSDLPDNIRRAISAVEPLLSTGSRFYELDIVADTGGPFTLRTWLSVDQKETAILGREYPPTLR